MINNHQVTTLNEFPNRAALCKSLDEFLQLGFDCVAEITGAEAAAIFTKEQSDLHLFASRGFADSFSRSNTFVWGRCLNGRVADTGESIVVDQAHPDKHYYCNLKGDEIIALMAVPLKSRGNVIGTLTAATHTNISFTQTKIHLLETLGNQLGIALENTMLYNKQKATTARLLESERQFRELFEMTNDVIWVEDLEGNLISANNACAKIMDCERSSLLHKNIREFIPESGVKNAIKVRQELLDGIALEVPYDQVIVSQKGIRKTLRITTNLLDLGEIRVYQHIAKDITEERKMQENLRFYIQQITQAQEEERLRISRELHDSTAQSLIAVLHQMEAFLTNTASLKVSDYRTLCTIVEQIKATLQEVRHFSRNLRPSILDDLGLMPALEWFTEELRRTHGLITTFRTTGEEVRLLPDVEVTLFRVVQEALWNVIRHAQASHALVSFAFHKDQVILTIQDNGDGFNVPSLFSDLPRQGKLGLIGMYERVQLIGGKLKVNSIANRGTTIKICAPIETITPYQF